MKRFFATCFFILSCILSVICLIVANNAIQISPAWYLLFGEFMAFMICFSMFFSALFFKGNMFDYIEGENDDLRLKIAQLQIENEDLKKEIEKLTNSKNKTVPSK